MRTPGVPSEPKPPRPFNHDESSKSFSVQPAFGSSVVNRHVAGSGIVRSPVAKTVVVRVMGVSIARDLSGAAPEHFGKILFGFNRNRRVEWIRPCPFAKDRQTPEVLGVFGNLEGQFQGLAFGKRVFGLIGQRYVQFDDLTVASMVDSRRCERTPLASAGSSVSSTRPADLPLTSNSRVEGHFFSSV